MDKLAELIQQVRHYRRLRFAIFPVFLAVTGGLMTAFFSIDAILGQLEFVGPVNLAVLL